MNRFGIAKLIIIFLLFSYFGVIFLRNYNSPENIEKRFIKFEKDFKISLKTPREELALILNLVDKNYLKCIGIPHY